MLPRITFCIRCKGLETGWNRRYIGHWLFCKNRLQKPGRLAVGLFVGALVVGFPKPGASVSAVPVAMQPATADDSVSPKVETALRSVSAFLKLHKVSESNRERLAAAIVSSARKHGLNPRLVASIIIVESRGNKFAISGQDAVGVMQVHLPTWGETADREDINLLKVEDNIDFGSRILKEYVGRYGVSEGIRRYNGYIPGEPSWEQSSQVYLDKVQQVYNFPQSPALQAK